tara:strand:- start:1180 stop:1413 length:234 start_codon:yes stop_codon:yes gene_type:complete
VKEGYSKTKRNLRKAESNPLIDNVMYQHPNTAFGPPPSPPNKQGSIIKIKSTNNPGGENKRLLRLSATTEKLMPLSY